MFEIVLKFVNLIVYLGSLGRITLLEQHYTLKGISYCTCTELYSVHSNP